jgi:hypothetical protein
MMRLGLWALVIAVVTFGVGWLAVPIVGLIMGLMWPRDTPVRSAAGAGALGWGLLLLWGVTRGPVVELAGLLGELLGGLPGAAILVITMLFPAVLAGAAAGMASAVSEMTGGEASLPRA